jgi:hypothetical protein
MYLIEKAWLFYYGRKLQAWIVYNTGQGLMLKTFLSVIYQFS